MVVDLEYNWSSVVCDVAGSDWSTINHINLEWGVSEDSWNVCLSKECRINEVVGSSTIKHGRGLILPISIGKCDWNQDWVLGFSWESRRSRYRGRP